MGTVARDHDSGKAEERPLLLTPAGKGGLPRLPAPALVFWETASGARTSWRFTAGTGVSPRKAAKNPEGLKRPGTMQRCDPQARQP